MKKTIGSIHFIPGIYPYGVSLLTPIYFRVPSLIFGPLVAKYLAENGIPGSEPGYIVPIYGHSLFLMYISDLSNVSEYCFTLLFADDMNMFHTGEDMKIVCDQVNEDLKNVQEWLSCNKLSVNICKMHCMIFTPRNKIIDDIIVNFL